MQVRILRQCDAPGPPGERMALFEGQVYDLPLDAANELISEGAAEAVTESKAVEEPPENKAQAAPRRRSRRNQ